MNHLKFVIFAFVLVLGITTTQSQQKLPGKAKKQIKMLMDDNNFSGAAQYINGIKKGYPNNATLQLQLGVCYLFMGHKNDSALSELEHAINAFPLNGKTLKKGIEAHFYYGQTLHRMERFNEAYQQFESLRKQIPPRQKELLTKIDKELRIVQSAIELSQNPVKLRVTNLGINVNSPFDDHSPLVSADESVLVFASSRPNTDGVIQPDGTYSEDIFISEYSKGQWQPAQNIGSSINSKGSNASVSLSADGNTLVIFHHNGLSGDLYVSNRILGGWSDPTMLPEPINSAYNETHGSFSADGNQFLFASNRPGGFGKSDIYMVRKLPTGQWGKAVNLGPAINTAGDEESPYLHPDNVTLHFASTEHNTMGGFDIFVSTQSDSGVWSTPVNVGYPINTPGDDLFYNPSVDGTRGYFASQRNDGSGDTDIYLIELDSDDPRSLAVVAGYIFNTENKPFAEVNISVEDIETGDIVGYYRPNTSTGKYVMILPSSKSYKVTYLHAKGNEERTFNLNSRQSYVSGNWAHFLEPLIIVE